MEVADEVAAQTAFMRLRALPGRDLCLRSSPGEKEAGVCRSTYIPPKESLEQCEDRPPSSVSGGGGESNFPFSGEGSPNSSSTDSQERMVAKEGGWV